MKILITGDLVVNQSYVATDKVDTQLIELFEKSDYNIVNLEAPVTASKNKIIKTGPHLKADKKSTLDVLKRLNVNIAALSNNHIKDYDEQGVLDTIEFCVENGIQPIGAGENIEKASRTHVLKTDEGTIAIINIAENEWASAGANSAGANGMDLIKDTRKIQQAKKENDFVFVIVHGGHEYYNLPSPRMQEQYRFYAEQGADLVVGHHTHCVSGYEIYQGTPIYYSLGNFLFTKSNPNEEWYTGLVLELNYKDGKLNIEMHPIRQEKESFKLKLLTGEEKKRVINRIVGYSKIIADKDSLLKEWFEFVSTKKVSYLNNWSPLNFIQNRYIKGILRRLDVNFSTTPGLALLLNLMRCEAHKDISQSVIEKNIKKSAQ